MYQVIGSAKTRTLRVLWMLEELGQSYEHLPAPPRDDTVRAMNPAGKIPVLVSDGVPITDSTAIIQYLADKHQALTHPAGSIERARQDSLTQFLLDEFDAILWTASRHSFVLPEELRVSAIKPTLKWEFEKSQVVLMDRMSNGPFIMGEKMTVPDILLAHCCGWAINARFEIKHAKLRNYLDQMRARPAYQRALAHGED